MNYTPTDIPFTIAFCLSGEQLLMLYRYRTPNQYKWNGVGGKLHPGESKEEAIARELREETGFELEQATSIDYTGIVSWARPEDKGNGNKGMYAFVVEFPEDIMPWYTTEIPEGILEWKAVDWVLDKTNHDVVSNIPHFLAPMLLSRKPSHYHCLYEEQKNGDWVCYAVEQSEL